MYLLFLLQRIYKVFKLCVCDCAEVTVNCVACLLCCYVVVCIWSSLLSQRQISTSVDDKLLFFVEARARTCVCACLPECLSVCAAALPVKDKCMRQWKQIWLRIKIDAERDGWLLALNTEALTFFHLCYILSISLALFIQLNFMAACSYWPLVTAYRAAINGFSSNAIGGEYCSGHIAVSLDNRAWPKFRLFSISLVAT